MEKQYLYKGRSFWVKVTSIFSSETNEHLGYVAYVNDEQPGALLYGKLLKHPDGFSPLICTTELQALTNAVAVKQSEIDSRPIKQ